MIDSIRYTNSEETEVQAVFTDGRVVSGDYPSGNHYDRKIQAWLDSDPANNVIQPYSKPLEEAKAEKIEVITANYENAEQQPVNIGGIDFEADESAQSEVLAVLFRVDKGDTLPADFTWLDAEGNVHIVTAANLVTLFKAINNKHHADKKNYIRLKKMVEAATSVGDVEAVSDW